MARPFNSPDVFRAVAHPIRRRMLDMLRQADCNPAEFAARIQVSKPTLSDHLRALRTAGLIQAHHVKHRVTYRLVPTTLREIDAWIRNYRKFLS